MSKVGFVVGLGLLIGVHSFALAETEVQTAVPPAAAAPTVEPKGDPSGLDTSGPLYNSNSTLAGWATGSMDKGGKWSAYKDPKNPTAQELSSNISHAFFSINFVWTLLAGFLVMFMQAGFALVETGLVRVKNAAHTMTMNLMVYALGMIGFFISGFALMCGGANGTTIGGPGGLGGIPVLNKMATIHLFGTDWGLFGKTGFFLSGMSYDAAAVVWFLFMMVFMDTTATIPTGALAERWKLKSFAIYSVLIGAVIYPVFAGWVWGGGWLAQLGSGFGLGHGLVDYAGSCVVHLQGGALAFILAKMLGPRIGKYDEHGKPRPIAGHNLPMVMLGTFILAFGWFGFNSGSSMAGSDGRIGVVAVNTMLASASGALAAALWMWNRFKKPDPTMMCNGMLAGLVAITAPCAFVAPWAAFLIGAIAGLLVVWSCFKVERAGIDDPVGAISVHGVCGLWGVLALGLFADGTYGAGFNGVGYSEYLGVAGKGVTGLLYGDSSQFWAQCIGILTCVTWNVVVGGALFWMVGKVVQGNRVSRDDEVLGLDATEVGVEAYVGRDDLPQLPRPITVAPGVEPVPATHLGGLSPVIARAQEDGISA